MNLIKNKNKQQQNKEKDGEEEEEGHTGRRKQQVGGGMGERRGGESDNWILFVPYSYLSWQQR